MEALKKEFRVLKLNTVRLRSQMEEITKKKTIDIEGLSKLESILSMYFMPTSNKMEEVVNQLLMMLNEEDANDRKYQEKLLEELDELVDLGSSIQGKIKSFHSKLSTEKARQSITVSSGNSLDRSVHGMLTPKLREIDPPRFEGDLAKFLEWKSLFENLVHNNDDLLNVQKLYYLKKSMTKEAEGILDDFGMTDEAYADAWGYVLSRFEKRRSIVLALFRKLLNVDHLKDEKGIQKLLDKINGIIRGLKAAGEKVDDTFSRFIAFYVGTKLDVFTFRDWENSLVSVDNYPKFEELNKFLQNRAFAVDDRVKHQEKFQEKLPKPTKKISTEQKSYTAFKAKCILCSSTHFLNQCSEFLTKTPQDRFEVVKKNRLCLICFSAGHAVSDCNSRFGCKCGAKHHSLLHFEFKNPRSGFTKDCVESSNAVTGTVNQGTSVPELKSSLSCLNSVEKIVLLPTAVVKFVCNNISGSCRVLLDSCSQPNLISDSFVRKFKLPINSKSRGNLIKGVSSSAIPTSNSVALRIVSKFKSFQVEIVADVVPSTSLSYSTHIQIASSTIEKLGKFHLADPAFLKESVSVPNIDLIIGAEHFERIMCNRSCLVEQNLFIRLSQFGWIVSGTATQIDRVKPTQFAGCTLKEIDKTLRQFWEWEEAVLPNPTKNLEIDQFYEHFEKTHSFAPDGKFVVKLPFKLDRSLVSNNRIRALSSLLKIDSSLDEALKVKYVDFMKDYVKAGHMSPVKPTSKPHYFIPHREVVRLESSTTPLRVVFNASSSVRGSRSLNDALMVGTNIQRDLFDILVSMRSYKFCFTADIAKMYRMIWVHESDRDMQRILWREGRNQPIQEYQLNTVTYGTVAASFIATKCLQVIARRLVHKHPVAARMIENNFYMDDLICGADSKQEVCQLQSVIHDTLASYGFLLRKYASNCMELLQLLDPESLAISSLVEFEQVSVLGLRWHPRDDAFSIRVNSESVRESVVFTKRIILSLISQIFDPLGLISPIIIRGKIIMQSLWLEGKAWDEPISELLSSTVVSFLADLCKLSSWRLPRSIDKQPCSEVFAFCDASEKAYCAAVYLRSIEVSGRVSCRLICSKTRVAPIRALTIPKLELMAANLLVDLVPRIVTNLSIDFKNVYAFSDSAVVLCWLSKPYHNWKTFVCNRIKKITDVIPFARWNYVKSEHNPADLGTRGLCTDDFLNNSIWFQGPNFLYDREPCSHFQIPNVDVNNILEKRKKVSLVTVLSENIVERFSSFTRMLRTVAYMYRFIKCRKLRGNFSTLSLQKFEIDFALNVLIRLSQMFCFRDEIERLKDKQPLKKKSPIRSLAPFLDELGVLRVGGRLERSLWSQQKKHPIILRAQSHLAQLIVRHTHEKYFHAGRTFLASYFSSEYWFVGGRTNLLKFVIRNCVVCTRIKGKVTEQLMGQLPRYRISVARVFTNVGVDFAGPFQCKCVAHRTTRYSKIYIAVFVCLAVRAVHIETVSDLSTAKFLETLQRFIARRGVPAKIFSDNATNFVGTRNFLRDNAGEISDMATNFGFEWHFIPPRSPHFGGIWEAAVRSAKFHLATVIKDAKLSFEEYMTLTAKVEAVLNSRPIAYKENVEQGSEPLTPAHFLVGQSLLSTPIVDEDFSMPLSNRLQLIRNLIKGFWINWSKDYLNHLQQRMKWIKTEPNIKVGQLVIVREENTPLFQWPLGVVEKIHAGEDGLVRVMDIRVRGGVRTRSLGSIVLLPIATEPLVQPGEDVERR